MYVTTCIYESTATLSKAVSNRSNSFHLFFPGALSISTVPRAPSGRPLFLSVCVMGAVVYWSYNAVLVAMLAVDVVVMPVESMEALQARAEVGVVVLKGTSYADYFKV